MLTDKNIRKLNWTRQASIDPNSLSTRAEIGFAIDAGRFLGKEKHSGGREIYNSWKLPKLMKFHKVVYWKCGWPWKAFKSFMEIDEIIWLCRLIILWNIFTNFLMNGVVWKVQSRWKRAFKSFPDICKKSSKYPTIFIRNKPDRNL